MPQALLLYNPFAHRPPDADLLRELRRKAELRGFRVEIGASREKGDLTRLASWAVGECYDRVIACGGDGTLREVAKGLLGSEIPMGVVPLGTANILAHEMELPVHSAIACAEVAAKGREVSVTTGEVAGEPFLFCASVGLDARAVLGVRLGLKDSLGPLAYVQSGAKALFAQEGRMHLIVENASPIEAAQVWAMKSRRYGQGWLKLTGKAGLTTPTLRLIAVRPPLRLRLPALLPMLFAHGIEGGPGVFARDVEAFSVVSPEGEPIQADGDWIAALPASFHARPNSLRLVLPS